MRAPPNQDLFAESTMTFGEHLEELRACLFKSLLWLAAGVCAGLYVGGDVVDYIKKPLSDALEQFYEKQAIRRAALLSEENEAGGIEGPTTENPELMKKLIQQEQVLPEEVYLEPTELLAQLKHLYPERFRDWSLPAQADGTLEKKNMLRLFLWRSVADDPRVKVKSFNVYETFSIYMKASVLVGAVLASPMVFYHLWSFVAAGLYRHEKRYVYVFFPFSLVLFLSGVALAFFVVFQPVLRFLFSFNDWMGIDPDPRISEWLGFVLILPLGFGIGFQLPLVMLFLERIGVFTTTMYLNQWRMAVLAIAVIAMILTPPDPYSMTLMAGPLTALYFGGILLCRLMPRMPSSPYADAE